jgi:hypothetical protein
MATDTVTVYGPGGYDPGKPDGNVVETHTVEIPPEEDNRRTIEASAAQALAANRTFLAIASPTNAQNAAQVKALTRQMNALIRLTLGHLDGTD